MKLFGPLYDRVLQWSRHPHAERYLGAMSFAESSFFPIPVDVMLAPMCLADRSRWVRFATIATVFSVLGGLAGYAIGWGMFEAIEPWLRESHYWDAYLTARQWFDEYGVWVVFVAGFSPIPFKVFTIAAGVAALSLPGFFIGSLIGRAARFFLVAGLVKFGGDRFEATLRKYVERIGWAVVVITAIGIAWFMMRG
ncbi:MAG: DedA family protein [Gammaproteobacteria bacterium]|nr:DedA family protein [Gammaproteobacteria bacterium]MBT8104710.1 DedA family protein [Gammaproteobacteria bacterium]NNF48917.1 DedA family protein [Woeseiaceae bacterium]NNK24724.1 DedA family protein [Woeseiaceae bacterium]NNL62417.1 DedA family protein [Woeseiaceae bacterium]